MAFEQYWQNKSNAELVAAAERLDEYTDVARRAILEEVQRRGLGASKDDGNATAKEELQFDRAIPASPDSPHPTPGAVCASCHALIESEYYDVNGAVTCMSCRQALDAIVATPIGLRAFFLAALFGSAAAIAGAAIYYAVLTIANLEIGLVAVLIGYMVGYAVRKGTGGRGGRRFQVLAVLLTYASVTLAYAPVVLKGLSSRSTEKTSVASSTPGTAATSRPLPTEPARLLTGREILLGLAFLLGTIAVFPVIVVVTSLPSGLITGVIIFVGMRQAWRMTRAPVMQILGPYRVGSAAADV